VLWLTTHPVINAVTITSSAIAVRFMPILLGMRFNLRGFLSPYLFETRDFVNKETLLERFLLDNPRRGSG
jgi:hypothetical protein